MARHAAAPDPRGGARKRDEEKEGMRGVRARALEEAGYISCTKSFEGRMPKTAYALTASGRKAFERYLDHMEALIRAARDA